MKRRLLGAILAGGASSRFGSDKALAVVDGRTLLDHARRALAEVADEVVIVGRAGGIPDLPVPGLGPLGGIAGALAHARRAGFAGVVTIGCDMPGAPAALLARLIERAPSYCADAPVLGHWPTALGPALLDWLSAPSSPPRPRTAVDRRPDTTTGPPDRRSMPAGTRHEGRRGGGARLSVRRWAEAIGAVAVPAPFPLTNVNTPADLP